ncbi:MAG: glycosyltransferase [Methanoregula sp.]|nr:glycosyltransferase [Methanoregula sp.]
MRAILALSFHPAFTPPKSGGEERLFYVLRGLSRYYDVTLVSFTHKNKDNTMETVIHAEHFKEIRIPKTIISSALHHFVGKYSSINECSAVITSIESRFNPNFKKCVKQELLKTDIIFCASPFLYTVPHRFLKGKKIVYDAYNNEYELMKHVFSNSAIGKFFLRYVYNIEKKLTKQCDMIFVVSDEDKNSLIENYHVITEKFYLAPNGIPVAAYNSVFFNRQGCKNPPICLFIGSYHPPNIEAVTQILTISAQLPEIIFLIAGNVSQYFTNQEGLTNQNLSQELPIFGNIKNIRLIAGFYPLEFWDTTPIVWVKPESKIELSENIESISIKLFSPHLQTIEVTGISTHEIFPLVTGWNILTIPFSTHQETTLSFTCEKELRDSGRVLGVAIQQIEYSKNGESLLFDLHDSQNRISTFINSENVYLLGQISDEEKKEILKISDIAINPMLSGSGTNIKVLGYLSAGIPTITTPMGARGLDLIDHNHALICEIADFPQKIHDLLSDDRLADSLKKNGHNLVEKRYDWEFIVHDMSEKIERF